MSTAAIREKTQELPVTHPSRHRRASSHPRTVELGLLAGLVVLAWAVPLGAHALRVDFLIPPAVLVGTASLLRAGRTLLDRLMLALCLLFGAVCAAGLGLSVWPWGLAPVPVAGVALTVLVGLAALTGRRPSLPRPSLADSVTVAAAAGVGLYLAVPYLRADLAGRLGLAMAGEDLARHLTLFDGVHQVGGYLFLHPGEARQYVYSGMIRYPQGFHLVSALIDGFLPHHDSGAVTAFNHLIGFHLAGYALMTLCVLWAARWIGGRALHSAWRWLPLVALVTALLVRGELVADFVDGYPSEIAGMALVAALVAVLVRPVAARRTQLLVVASLLVAIGFTYYLFLPGMGLATVAWLVLRRRWLPGRAFVAVCCVVTGALALFPMALGLLAGGQAQSLKVAAGFHNSRSALAAVTLIVAAAVLAPAARRSPLWRRYRWVAASLLGDVFLLGLYQKVATGHPGYYFEKSLHAVQILLLLGLASVTTLLPAPAPCGRTRLALAMPSVLLAAAVGIGLGVSDSPYRPMRATATGVPAGNWGAAWVSDRLALREPGQLAARVVRLYGPHPSGVTVLLSDNAYTNYSVSLFAAALVRNAGTPISRGFYIGRLPGASNEAVRAIILDIGVPVTAVVTSPRIAALVRQLQHDAPGRHLQLIDLSRPAAPQKQ